MAEVVYFLCAVTSAWCAVLLVKTYVRRQTLAWLGGSLCFMGLAANNAVAFLVSTSWLEIDLSLVRAALGAAAGIVFAVVLAWDTR